MTSLIKKPTSFFIASLLLIAVSVTAQEYRDSSAPVKLIDAFHSAFGDNHSRAVHAKGIILTGSFTPAKEASSLTSAFHLQDKSSEVVLRYSDFTGIPKIPDNIAPANPRGIAIKFTMKDGRATDVIGHSFNGFPVATTDEFRVFLQAIGASGPDAPKPTALDNFIESHPITKTFLTTQKCPASWSSITYFGVNSFEFINSKGVSHFIRYQFVPAGGEEIITPEQMAAKDADYLLNDIKARIGKHPIRIKVYAQVAGAGDNIENPSIAWPDSRNRVLLGVIELRNISRNTEPEDKALLFNPGNVPVGIQMADPMVKFRSRAYPISVAGRQ